MKPEKKVVKRERFQNVIFWKIFSRSQLIMNFFLSFLYSQKIEKPFLEAVSVTLGDRYTENVEGIYKITIKLIIETLIEGYVKAPAPQNSIQNNKSVNNNTNGANPTLNGDTSCSSSSKQPTDKSS